MLKKIALAAVAASILSAAPALSETIELPVAPENRDKVASMLMEDPELANAFFLKYAQAKMGNMPDATRMARQIAGSDNMTQGPAGGMEPEKPQAAQPKKTQARIPSAPSSGMGADDGMVKPQGQLGQKTAAEPDTTPMFADSPGSRKAEENPALKFGPVDSHGWPIRASKGKDVAPSGLDAERVDLFLSLTCPFCGELWQKARQHASVRDHMLEDRVNIWVLPRSTSEAGVALIFQMAYDQDPQKGYEFIDYFFSNRAKYAKMRESEVFNDFNEWMKENGLPSVLDLKKNKRRVEELGNELGQGLELGRVFQIQAFPSIFVNGQLDDEWFNKVIANADKSGSDGGAKADEKRDGGK